MDDDPTIEIPVCHAPGLLSGTQSYAAIARTLLRVREGYGANWDPNLFRALDDVTRELGDPLGGEAYAKFLTWAGVTGTSIRRHTP